MSIPEHLISEFWNSVQTESVKKYALSNDDARTEIEQFKKAMEREVGTEFIYHREPAEIAKAISIGGYVKEHEPVK